MGPYELMKFGSFCISMLITTITHNVWNNNYRLLKMRTFWSFKHDIQNKELPKLWHDSVTGLSLKYKPFQGIIMEDVYVKPTKAKFYSIKGTLHLVLIAYLCQLLIFLIPLMLVMLKKIFWNFINALCNTNSISSNIKCAFGITFWF